MILIMAYGFEDFANGKRSEPSCLIGGKSLIDPIYIFWTCVNGVLKIWIYGSISNTIYFVVTHN